MNPTPALTRRKLIAAGAGAALLSISAKVTGHAQSATPSAAASPAPVKPAGPGVRVVPYPAPEPIGQGKERALVLGGGGEWFEAWQLAYVSVLAKGGIDLGRADAVVGTSAGSVLGTCLTSGRIAQEADIFAWFGKHPDYMSRLIVVNTGAESQLRARKLQLTTQTFEPGAIKAMGSAAMAAKNAPVSGLQTAIQQIIGPMDWPSPAMHTTANDCYTGERLVVYPDSGIPINEAISASMSLPGCFGPTWLDDHYCMDGGISRSGTHADLMAGAKRVVVIALSNGDPQYAQLSPFHAPISEELDVVRKSGSELFVTYANPPKDTNFLDPKEMPVAVEMGAAQAKADLPTLAKLWNS
jgi:NTE family protein